MSKFHEPSGRFLATSFIIFGCFSVDWLMAQVYCLFVVGACIVPYSIPVDFWLYAVGVAWTIQLVMLIVEQCVLMEAKQHNAQLKLRDEIDELNKKLNAEREIKKQE